MWPQLHFLSVKLKSAYWWQQHIMGCICLVLSSLLFWCYWVFYKNHDYQQLQEKLQLQLQYQANMKQVIMQQILLKKSHEFSTASTFEQQQEPIMPNIISQLLKQWPINYSRSINEANGKIQWKIENILPREKLSLVIKLLFEKLDDTKKINLSIVAHPKQTDWIHFILGFEDD